MKQFDTSFNESDEKYNKDSTDSETSIEISEQSDGDKSQAKKCKKQQKAQLEAKKQNKHKKQSKQDQSNEESEYSDRDDQVNEQSQSDPQHAQDQRNEKTIVCFCPNGLDMTDTVKIIQKQLPADKHVTLVPTTGLLDCSESGYKLASQQTKVGRAGKKAAQNIESDMKKIVSLKQIDGIIIILPVDVNAGKNDANDASDDSDANTREIDCVVGEDWRWLLLQLIFWFSGQIMSKVGVLALHQSPKLAKKASLNVTEAQEALKTFIVEQTNDPLVFVTVQLAVDLSATMDEQIKKEAQKIVKTNGTSLINQLINHNQDSVFTSFASTSGFLHFEAEKAQKEWFEIQKQEVKNKNDMELQKKMEKRMQIQKETEEKELEFQSLKVQQEETQEEIKKENKVLKEIRSKFSTSITSVLNLPENECNDFKKVKDFKKHIDDIEKSITGKEQQLTKQINEHNQKYQKKITELEKSVTELTSKYNKIEKENYDLKMKEQQLGAHKLYKTNFFFLEQNIPWSFFNRKRLGEFELESQTYNEESDNQADVSHDIQDTSSQQDKGDSGNDQEENDIFRVKKIIKDKYDAEEDTTNIYAHTCALASLECNGHDEILQLKKQLQMLKEDVGEEQFQQEVENLLGSNVTLKSEKQLELVETLQKPYDYSHLTIQFDNKGKSIHSTLDNNYCKELFEKYQNKAFLLDLNRTQPNTNNSDNSEIVFGFYVYQDQHQNNIVDRICLQHPNEIRSSLSTKWDVITAIYLIISGKKTKMAFGKDFSVLEVLNIVSLDDVAELKVDLPQLKSLSVKKCTVTGLKDYSRIESIVAHESKLDCFPGDPNVPFKQLKRLHLYDVRGNENNALIQDLDISSRFPSIQYFNIQKCSKTLERESEGKEVVLKFSDVENLIFFYIDVPNVSALATLNEIDGSLCLPVIITPRGLSCQMPKELKNGQQSKEIISDMEKNGKNVIKDYNKNKWTNKLQGEIDKLKAEVSEQKDEYNKLETKMTNLQSTNEYIDCVIEKVDYLFEKLDALKAPNSSEAAPASQQTSDKSEDTAVAEDRTPDLQNPKSDVQKQPNDVEKSQNAPETPDASESVTQKLELIKKIVAELKQQCSFFIGDQ